MSEQPAAKYSLKDLKRSPSAPRPPRLPPISVPEDYMNLQYLDDEEKELVGVQLISRLEKFDKQATVTVATAAHDPKAARMRSAYGGALMALAATSYETRHLVGGSLLHLLVVSVMKHAKDECLSGGLSTTTRDYRLPGFESHHLMLMDYPDSEVWSVEQRLMLRFAKAVLENTMTDALWREAVDAWNPKMCVRYIHVINFFLGAAVMNRTLGVTHPLFRENPVDYDFPSKINVERKEWLKRQGKA